MSRLIYFSILFFCAIHLQAQVTINITSLPENTVEGENIYFASNINGWNPSDTNYIFKKENEQYIITINPPSNDAFEFKCTRGTWDKVECSKTGEAINNHAFTYEGKPLAINIEIEAWQDLDGKQIKSTRSENVHIISEEFFIPQLNRKRRVWIYLPTNYSNSENRYPVLYMHDGQNVFDELTSYSGEWKVDETLDEMYPEKNGCIIVAVDNGGEHRLDEYSPWKNEQYGGGEGTGYIRFLVNDLKPFIDKNYRTLSNRKNTGIAGSSMGGLISLYAGIEYPEVFSKLGVFSPAFWFSEECYRHVQEKGKQLDARIYLQIGALEGKRYVNGMASMYQVLRNVGFQENELFYILDKKGQHNEASWAKHFPDAFKWLMEFPNENYSPSELPHLKIKRLKEEKILFVDIHPDLGEVTLEIKHCKKKKRSTHTISGKQKLPLKLLGKRKQEIIIKDKNGIVIFTHKV